MAATNSWLEYKNAEKCWNINKNKILDLLQFRMEVAESLIKENKTPIRKQGRSQENIGEETTSVHTNFEYTSSLSVRTAGGGNFPEHSERRVRCKNPTCNGQSRWYCIKRVLSIYALKK